MQARSFMDDMWTVARHFYATTIRGEISDSNVRNYLLSAEQIEEVWQQIETQIAAQLAQGLPPWQVYGRLRYPLAFIRAARTYQVFAQELLSVNVEQSSQATGYLHPLTYDQIDALCQQIQPNLQRAQEALGDPHYTPDVALPQILGPQIEAEGQPAPLAHLQAMMTTTHKVRSWATDLLTLYDNAISAATTQQPSETVTHRAALQGLLTQADSQLRFSSDLIAQLAQESVTNTLRAAAETNLWNALRSFFLLNQAIASPEILHSRRTTVPLQARQAKNYDDRTIKPDDLWIVAAPAARSELRGTAFGRAKMEEMCERMHHTLTAHAQQYLDEVALAEARGDIVLLAAMANSPFEPLYRARRPITIVETDVASGQELHWNFIQDRLEVSSRFGRVRDWQEIAE